MDALTSAAPEMDGVVRAAQDELDQAIQRGGLARDPMRFALRALSSTLGAMHGLHRAEREHHDDVRRILDEQTRAAVDRAKTEMRAAEAVTVERIATAIAASADAALTRRVRVFDRNTAVAASGVLFAVTAMALGGGYLWGATSARAAIQQTEAGLRVAFREGPATAQTWLTLMRANNPDQALAGCTGSAIWTAPDGRRACRAALWLDMPHTVAPDMGGATARTLERD
jgi:hypothetical protein